MLLAGAPSAQLCAMHAQLSAVGARPVCFSAPFNEESLCRALHEGRFSCVIVPDLLALHACAQQRPAALNTLLGEAREAGVPLVMLLCADISSETAQLFSHALGFAHGACGDPVSVQCIRHADADDACPRALELGARFLSGDRSCTGVFVLPTQA